MDIFGENPNKEIGSESHERWKIFQVSQATFLKLECMFWAIQFIESNNIFDYFA